MSCEEGEALLRRRHEYDLERDLKVVARDRSQLAAGQFHTHRAEGQPSDPMARFD
jgi:hypothetical protein